MKFSVLMAGVFIFAACTSLESRAHVLSDCERMQAAGEQFARTGLSEDFDRVVEWQTRCVDGLMR